MRAKSIILLVLALGCGLVASIGISQVIERNKKNAPSATETENIIVASTPIDANMQIKPENIKLEAWPKHLIPKNALTKLEEVEGERAKHSITAGEPILQNKLVGEDDGNATGSVPPGYRLITVHADAVNAVGNLVKPNDRVDMLVYLKNDFKGNNNAGTKTILQDLKVFAVNDQWRQSEDKSTDPIAVKNVTLLVTPEQAEKITLATELGKIKLVLRSPDETVNTPAGVGMTASSLFGSEDLDTSRDDERAMLAKNAKKEGLLGLLGPKPEPAAPAVVLPPPAEQFVMHILEGPEQRKVEFTKIEGENKGWSSTADAGGAAGSGAVAMPSSSGLPATPPAVDTGSSVPAGELLPPSAEAPAGDASDSPSDSASGPLLSE
ncbi:MAG: Flp pilus assembly protein CpaB [Planctomycetota bacterium]|nr:Flp pilus assembly protein CpaB [Planctomycetota bacterium]